MADTHKIPDFLGYNLVGFRPVKSTFMISIEDLEKKIKEISEKEIDGILHISHECDSTNGAVAIFLWFDSRSKHFYDRATEATAINTGINRYSSEFDAFMQKYGWNEADDGISDNRKVRDRVVLMRNTEPEAGRNLIALRIALTPYLKCIFDMPNGAAYKKEFGVDAVPRTDMSREWKYRKGSKGKYHSVVGLQIEKYVRNSLQDRTTPRTNGNFK